MNENFKKWLSVLPLMHFILFMLLMTGCFSMDHRGGIVRYQNGQAFTAQGAFRGGKLPPSWKGPSVQLKQLVYTNNSISGTILVDALCGEKFIDAPLARLAKDLFDRMESQKLGDPEEFTLGGRLGVKVEGEGTVDGVPIKMQAAVMKKDFCLYDFVYFSPPKYFNQGLKDFNQYLHGFQIQ